MAGGSNGYRAALVRRQHTLVLISSLPGTAGLPPFIFFSTSCNSPSIAGHSLSKSPSRWSPALSEPMAFVERDYEDRFSSMGEYAERATARCAGLALARLPG